MKDQANDKRSTIIACALILTVALLAAFGWLLSRTKTCDGGWWLWDRLACLEPNALGDTFAGAFAPVAFVWLVAAVMLQRNELAAQRQELRQSRAVAAEQVEEAKKNVAFIEAQTLILEANKALEIRRDADEQFEEMLDLFNRSFLGCESFAVWEDLPSIEDKQKSWRNFRMTPQEGRDVYEITKKNLEQISNLSFAIEIFGKKDKKFKYKNFYVIDGFASILETINSSSVSISPAMAARALFMDISTTTRELREMIQVLQAQGNRAGWREVPDDNGYFRVRTPDDDEIPF
jgi:hypothetical protein